MIKIAKYLIYIAIGLGIVFLVWFLPKYSYVKENPGYCANLTTNLYYCGSESNLKEVFNSDLEDTSKNSSPDFESSLKDELKSEAKSQLESEFNSQFNSDQAN